MFDPDEVAEWEDVAAPGNTLGSGEGLTAGLAFAFAASSRTSDGTGVSAIANMCASVMWSFELGLCPSLCLPIVVINGFVETYQHGPRKDLFVLKGSGEARPPFEVVAFMRV